MKAAPHPVTKGEHSERALLSRGTLSLARRSTFDKGRYRTSVARC